MVKSPSGTNTISRWRALRSAPVITGTFGTYYEDHSWLDARDNKTKKAIFYQINQTAGESFLLSIPNAQITDVQVSDAEGLQGQTVTFQGGLDTDTTESTATDLGQSPFRIHLG